MHCYNIQGQQLPSVTTILSATRPFQSRASSGNTSAVLFGSAFHLAIQNYLSGFPVSEEITTYSQWRHLKPFLDVLLKSNRFSERLVWDFATGFAGVTDLIFFDPFLKQWVLLDWKVTREGPLEINPHSVYLKEAKLQVTAYLEACKSSFVVPSFACIVRVSPFGLFFVPVHFCSNLWEEFLNRKNLFDIKSDSKNFLNLQN